ncbi:cag island protein [Helicobacter pylori]|nr:cag island protein [Helicobacter pylori]
MKWLFIAMSNNYNELKSCLAENIKDSKILDPLLQKIQKFEQEANTNSRNFNHLSSIRFANNDNDFRNYALLVSEQKTKNNSKLTEKEMEVMDVALMKILDFWNVYKKDHLVFDPIIP